ncbi:hypothetical protein B0I37DRAFT_417670 [Chaetomium sp. MPI-CAGE-AT-0009]|nr:hypothetical protein B0I37DRAFT_417670 [Chaetomium sp. MPI-CAGE-AT-0009]
MDSQTAANAPIPQPAPAELHNLHTTQPPASQPMNPQKPHPESEAQLGLRGGRSSFRGGLILTNTKHKDKTRRIQ